MQRPAPPNPRPTGAAPTRERIAAWLVTGPVGHLVGGVMDWGELLGRYWWSRLRGRPVHAWDRADTKSS